MSKKCVTQDKCVLQMKMAEWRLDDHYTSIRDLRELIAQVSDRVRRTEPHEARLDGMNSEPPPQANRIAVLEQAKGRLEWRWHKLKSRFIVTAQLLAAFFGTLGGAFVLHGIQDAESTVAIIRYVMGGMSLISFGVVLLFDGLNRCVRDL